jgi:peptide/nickel transport system ATP-binding protein
MNLVDAGQPGEQGAADNGVRTAATTPSTATPAVASIPTVATPPLSAADANDTPVLTVSDLQVSFASEAGTVRAVRGMNFELRRGETLGIVGESGSGKSVTSMSVMGLLDSNAEVKGSITYRGEELLTKTDAEMSKIRGKGIAMVFQDPLSAPSRRYTASATRSKRRWSRTIPI